MAYWPGGGFGLGFTVLKDPAAAQTAESPQQISVVAFTNTALEGMSGQFTTDLSEAVYAGLSNRTL